MKRLLLLLFLLPFTLHAQFIGGSAQSSKPKAPGAYVTDIAYEAVGTQSSGTTSCTPAYPTVSAGNGLIMAVGSKLRDPKVDTPSGWERIDETMDMVESSGGDVGEIRQTIFWKEAIGTESGTVSVVCDACNSLNAVIYAYSKDSNARWKVNSSGGTTTAASASYSVTSKHKLQSRKNDVLVVISSINTDLYAYNAQAVTQTGATFSTVNAEIGEYATTEGNDQEQFASVFQVTAASVVSAKFVYTATANGSAASNPLGTTHFIQLRQYFAPQDLPPSGLQVWRASEVVDGSYSGDASGIWDGMRTSITSTGTVSGNGFSIATHNGRPCFKYTVLLQDATNYWMRGEVSKPCPWQPAFEIGTHLIHEVRYETPASVPTVYREFGVLQCHTGTAPGGPWPLNSPLFYYGFAYAGQTGWTGGGTATGGEFIVVSKTAGTRYKYSGVTLAPSTTYRVRTHTKFDIASGDPCHKVWVAVNDGDFTLLYEDYTAKTVFEASDIAADGSVELVGGAIKTGIYNHMITNGTLAANSIAAGNSGYTLLVPAEIMIVSHPSDADYITDVTDNNHRFYDWVDTSNE